jgi:hypothetical protein
MKVEVERKKELMGECAGARRTMGAESARRFRKEREWYSFSGRRGRFVLVGGEGQGSQREGNKPGCDNGEGE